MEEELFIVKWLCKVTKKQKSFLWTHHIDDVMNKRVIFTNEDTLEVVTIATDSLAWMITRPASLEIGNN